MMYRFMPISYAVYFPAPVNTASLLGAPADTHALVFGA